LKIAKLDAAATSRMENGDREMAKKKIGLSPIFANPANAKTRVGRGRRVGERHENRPGRKRRKKKEQKG